jgi:hypothetical protein
VGLIRGKQKQRKGPDAWRVGLMPKEREILSTEVKEKFPPRYERDLILYYRNLAASRPGASE